MKKKKNKKQLAQQKVMAHTQRSHTKQQPYILRSIRVSTWEVGTKRSTPAQHPALQQALLGYLFVCYGVQPPSYSLLVALLPGKKRGHNLSLVACHYLAHKAIFLSAPRPPVYSAGLLQTVAAQH